MPAADVSGEGFSLNAHAAYEGLVEAEACHGLSLEASAAALAQANASFGFLLAARGTGFGRASAGVAAKAQLNPDIFDRFGLILEAAAAAEAAAGGRLSDGLDFAEVSRFAEENLDGLALQLFLAFLEEIVLEAGAWARIAAASMAAAHADITVPDFLDWLLSGNRLQVMEFFLATTPYGPWTGYRGPRSYGWHHRRLKDFYSWVFPGE
jgi:hypothetical protein